MVKRRLWNIWQIKPINQEWFSFPHGREGAPSIQIPKFLSFQEGAVIKSELSVSSHPFPSTPKSPKSSMRGWEFQKFPLPPQILLYSPSLVWCSHPSNPQVRKDWKENTRRAGCQSFKNAHLWKYISGNLSQPCWAVWIAHDKIPAWRDFWGQNFPAGMVRLQRVWVIQEWD